MTRYAESARPGTRWERGAATLIAASVLLFAAALVTLAAARVIVTEQRLAANDVRARGAFAAAEAGLETALGALPAPAAAPALFDDRGWTRYDGPGGALPDGSDFQTIVNNQGLRPHDLGLLRIESFGRSADRTASRHVEQLAYFVPLLAHPPAAPLVVRGAARVENLSLVNPLPRALMLWAGGRVSPAVPAGRAGPGACKTQGVCARDPRLARLSPARFFENFFGRPAAAVWQTAQALDCLRCPAQAFPDGVTVFHARGRDGTALAGGDIGSAGKPALLIVDGDLEVTTDTRFYGLIYVSGNWRPGPGRLTLNGALLVAGDADTRTPAEIVYDPDILERLRTQGRYARVAGSWSDW